MNKHAAAAAHDAISVATDAPYAGPPGQTRFESVHLVQPDGSLATVAVCRAINTRTHPELKLRALAGLLHRLEDGRELALSFVYHDPGARKFALVVPSVLAHTELKEWSKLMAEIAEDTRHLVPLYVRETTTIIGVHALERYALDVTEIDEASVASSDEPITNDEAAREHLLIQRERELAEQERALIRLAEGLTTRESDLNRRHEQLETARIDLEIRETELIDRRDDADVPASEPGWTEVGVARAGAEATLVGVGSSDAFERAGSVSGATLIGVGADAPLIGAGADAALIGRGLESGAKLAAGRSRATSAGEENHAFLAGRGRTAPTDADERVGGTGRVTHGEADDRATFVGGRSRAISGDAERRGSFVGGEARAPLAGAVARETFVAAGADSAEALRSAETDVDAALLVADADARLFDPGADTTPLAADTGATLVGLGPRTRLVDPVGATVDGAWSVGRGSRPFKSVRSARDSWLSPRHRPPPLPLRGSSAPPPLPLRSRSAPPPLPARTRSEPPPRRGGLRAPPPLAAADVAPGPVVLARISSEPPPLPLRQRSDPQLMASEHTQPANGAHASATRLSSGPPPLPKHALPANPAPVDAEAEPEVAPPAFFFSRDTGPIALKLVDDELWLFGHVEESRATEVQRGVDLMLQYVELESYPVAMLSLLSHGPEPYVLRHALDGHSEADRRVLEHLSRSFRARAALYIGGAYCETLTAATLREGVAQTILDRIARLPLERAALEPSEALARVLAAPPALSHDDLPFGPSRREASTTATVLASVEQLASWLRPEKLEEATLTYSVPRNVVEATIRRVVRAAVAFGIALPDELFARGVEYRAARDQPSLIAAQLLAFQQRVSSAQNDLGAAATRKNWERLFERAQAQEVAIDPELRTLAQGDLPSVRPDATRPLRPFEGLGPQELRARLQVEGDRLEAIYELCVRGHPGSIALVLDTLDHLTPEQAASAVAHLMLFREAAGDQLVAALNSDHERVRHLAALALGKLKLRRALLPMLQRLEAEPTSAYPELARAVGDFGASALRVVVSAIPASARPDRLMLALAHLANHGAAKEVEKLENDPDPSIALAARKAMARRSRMEWEDLAVRQQRSLGDAEPTTHLSQAFYAELAKVAI